MCFFCIIVNVAHKSQFPIFFYSFYLLLGLRRLTFDGGASSKYVKHMDIVSNFMNEIFSQPPLSWFPFHWLTIFFFAHLFVWLHLVSILAILIEQWQEPQVFWWPPVGSLEDLCLDSCVQNLCTWRSTYSPKDIMSKTRRIMKKNDRYLGGNKQGLPLLSNSLKDS